MESFDLMLLKVSLYNSILGRLDFLFGRVNVLVSIIFNLAFSKSVFTSSCNQSCKFTVVLLDFGAKSLKENEIDLNYFFKAFFSLNLPSFIIPKIYTININ